MAVKGVIFDLGHTLMHLQSTWPEILERSVLDLAAFVDGQRLGPPGEVFARALVERRREGLQQAQETGREVTAEASMRWTFARFGLPQPDQTLLRAAIDAFFAFEESRWQADPQALPLLRTLAGQGLQLGLFSNATDDRFIQRLVDRFGFRPWLEPVLSSAGTGIRKPEPAAFAPFLEAWGLEPGAVAVVGDTLEADILGANRAGMHSVWLRSRADARPEGRAQPAGTDPEQLRPEVTIERLTELPDRLAGL